MVLVSFMYVHVVHCSMLKLLWDSSGHSASNLYIQNWTFTFTMHFITYWGHKHVKQLNDEFLACSMLYMNKMYG